MRVQFIHTETPVDILSSKIPLSKYMTTHICSHTHYTHAHSEGTESKDEEDFDQFLESVKARQLSLTAKGEPSLSPLSITHHAYELRGI